MSDGRANILVIKLGALGDFVQAFGPMAAIRKHHPSEKITLLTTAPFESLARNSPYFDEIWIDKRPKWHDVSGWLALRRTLNGGNFSRVYDLQNNDRTAFYLKLFSPRPEWVGSAPGASHRNNSKQRIAGIAFDGHVQTLAIAGITDVKPDTLEWIRPLHDFALPEPYVLIVIGASPQHPEKRWPHYADFCRMLVNRNYLPVLIGGPGEKTLAKKILENVPTAHDLTGKSALADLPYLALNAAGAVGNDTGPMHFIAPTGCKSLVLFSGKSSPERHAPLGSSVISVQRNDLSELSADEVWKEFSAQQSLPP